MISSTLIFVPSGAFAAAVQAVSKTGAEVAWWVWPLLLFVVSFFIGVLGVIGGVGGGSLYVPIIGGFFPFHLDFVRGAGLLVALSGSISAGPSLLKERLADLRLTLPAALIASVSSIVGAMVGFALPTNIVQTALGVAILCIVFFMALAKKSEYPEVKKASPLAVALKINGIYRESSTGEDINWEIHRARRGLASFVAIGFMAGIFGIGGGWANVPVLNLMMGVPLKVAVATSNFLLSVTATSAAWMYINNGAVLPMLVVPSIIGVMLGSRVGAKILVKTKPAAVRYIVIIMLFLTGTRTLLKGLSIWK
ncbi:MAG: sulfite exporter TauE/SafE family protein [Actinomycetota bacterium]|nr:sulfite exporter TauE/SafE family protein [Actinomycetota bacterium]